MSLKERKRSYDRVVPSLSHLLFESKLFLRRCGYADHTHGPEVATEVTIQIQGQFAGIGFVRNHTLMARIEFFRMNNKNRHPQRGELAMQVNATRPGFVNDKHRIGERELFLHERQERGRGEPLRWLRRLAVAHPRHPEMIGVPIHTQLELPDTGLRFGVGQRSCFQGMVVFGFHTLTLSPVATSFSTQACFTRLYDHLIADARLLTFELIPVSQDPFPFPFRNLSIAARP
jgi:hypothetical protein